MNSSNANDRYGSSLERTPGAGKPVDPATRLSELLAQSLEELTRPFDPPRPGQNPPPSTSEDAAAPESAAVAEGSDPHDAPAAEALAENSRMDPALAELEAELFAAAKQVDSENTETAEEAHQPPEDHAAEPFGDLKMSLTGEKADEKHDESPPSPPALAVVPPPPLAPSDPAPEIEGDAARVIARVRRLMLVSMAVTLVAVGSVFGFIGYRVYKNGGSIEKKADKLPESSPIPADVTLSLPRGARIVQSAVAADRLVLTLDIDGKIEVRTFDVKTLQPAGRLNFSATP